MGLIRCFSVDLRWAPGGAQMGLRWDRWVPGVELRCDPHGTPVGPRWDPHGSQIV